jgi:DNA-directed RNA polymerase subunit RPC12/RpoP
MGERKVLNKYYPPDFDPALLPRGRKPKDGQITVRMMLPMSVRCQSCGEFLYKGTKFNAKKETVEGEEYKGIKIFRFYMRCSRCSTEFTIKTDPENSDYVCDTGVSRNFEPWRDRERVIQEAKKERELEEEGDIMKQLENKTLDSKLEMDILDALAEIRALNSQNSKISADALMQEYQRRMNQLDEDEEEQLKSIQFKNSADYVRRIQYDDDDEDNMKGVEASSSATPTTQAEATQTPAPVPAPTPAPSPTVPLQRPQDKKPAVKVVPKFVVKPKGAANSSTPSDENPHKKAKVSLVDY